MAAENGGRWPWLPAFSARRKHCPKWLSLHTCPARILACPGRDCGAYRTPLNSICGVCSMTGTNRLKRTALVLQACIHARLGLQANPARQPLICLCTDTVPPRQPRLQGHHDEQLAAPAKATDSAWSRPSGKARSASPGHENAQQQTSNTYVQLTGTTKPTTQGCIVATKQANRFYSFRPES